MLNHKDDYNPLNNEKKGEKASDDFSEIKEKLKLDAKLHENNFNNAKNYNNCFKENPFLVGISLPRPNVPKIESKEYQKLSNCFEEMRKMHPSLKNFSLFGENVNYN